MSVDVHPPTTAAPFGAEPSPWTEAQLLILQHPELGRVRFSCSCTDCHHQILARRFCVELADAWVAVRGAIVNPADVPAL